MAKENKRKLFFITVFAIVLLSYSAYVSLMPSANAAEATTAKAKGLTVISQVVGVDLTKYNATPTLDVNGPYFGGLPTKNIRYTLAGNGSHIEMLDTFTDGSLQMIDVLENSGSPYMNTSAANVAGMAKTFLLNYKSYSANTFYGQLASMLNADPFKNTFAKNSTTTAGNLKFDITTTSGNSPMVNSTTFAWSYTSNGVDAACKCVSLGYKNGFLKSFINNWNLYPIGSTTVNLSQQEAEAIAMQKAKAYSWTIGSGNETYVINNFNVTKPMYEQLVFCEAGNAVNARSSNPLTLYPMWRIGVGLDKYYPGNVFGIYVDIWADTGQVRGIQELFSTLPPPAGADVATLAESSTPTVNDQAPAGAAMSNMFPAVWMALATFAVFTVGVVPVWLSRKKNSGSLRLPKLRKISGAVLCLLVCSVALVALASAVPTANAAYANIWGDNSTGGQNSSGEPYLYHTHDELTNQSMISAYITSLFSSCGYSSMNYEDGYTYKSNVLSVTHSDDQISSVATVYFDHGIGKTPLSHPYENEFHYMLCDPQAVDSPTNFTGDIFDYEIFDATSNGYTYFSYISTCMSANLTIPSGCSGTYGNNSGGSGYVIGMPYAWTHGASISTDGYGYPDSGKYCYIGFPWGSAPLSQPPDPSNFPTVTYGEFVSSFFYNALSCQLTVNQALDAAAYQWFPYQTFAGTLLHQDFAATWPRFPGDNPQSYSGCKMVVYGNGDMCLYAGSPDYVTTPSVSGPTTGDIGTYYQFSASSTDPYGHSIQYTFDWGDGSQNVTGWYDSGVTAYASHSWSSAKLYGVTVTAQSDIGTWSSSGYSGICIGPLVNLTVLARNQYGYAATFRFT
jgi:hypothetical protein